MRIAALQYCAGEDADVTLPAVEALIARAVDKDAKMVCLPEVASFLPANREALHQLTEHTHASASLERLQAQAAVHKIWLLVGSMLMRTADGKDLVNRSHLIDPSGAITAIYDKIHMFDADVGDGKSYRESDHFRPGTSVVDVPTNKAHFGLSICYDIRFARLYRNLAHRGAEIITIPAAFTRPSGQAHWHVLQRARAIETGCFVLASAQIGTHDDGRETYGHSLIVNPWGEVLADAGTMEEGFVMAALDLEEVTIARQKIRNLQHAPDYS